MQELTIQEVDQVSGGLAPFVIPVAIVVGSVIAGGVVGYVVNND